MWLDVYIGELSSGADPLDWGGDWNGNVPDAKSPMFPPHGGGSLQEYPFPQLIDRISSGRFQGKQVDWVGGWQKSRSRKFWISSPSLSWKRVVHRSEGDASFVSEHASSDGLCSLATRGGTFALVATEL